MNRYITRRSVYYQDTNRGMRLNSIPLNFNYPRHKPLGGSFTRKEVINSVNVAATSPKHELRGVWVTTVRNTDFPSPEVFANGEFNIDLFKREFLDIIYRCKELKLNAIFFQVRPEGDAFYASGVNPWSAYLTGVQGVEPNWGNFDPLAWMIEATHSEGIEFHAWFNPYRITPSDRPLYSKEELLERLSPTHYARRHPDWTYYFNGQLYLNPGVPEVNQYMVQTVREVLDNYNVDAIHLDDFFYPYSYQTYVNGELVSVSFADESPDYNTFLQYRREGQTIDEWREYNINNLVFSLSNAVRSYNEETGKSVAFGISPFGVWASAEETGGIGSQTSPLQLSSLSEYVNSKLWVDSGWLDYIVPQNYWAFTDPLSPFDTVAAWWNDVVAGTNTQLYMGLGLYLYEEDTENPAWQDPEQIIDQIRYLRTLGNNKGYVFFTYHNLLPERAETEALREALVLLSEQVQNTFSLVPPRQNLQTGITQPVQNLRVSKCDEGCNLLTFEDLESSNSQYYVIYRVEGAAPKGIDTTNPRNILNVIGKIRGEGFQHYTDYQIVQNRTYTYAVTALSQAQVESAPITTTFTP